MEYTLIGIAGVLLVSFWIIRYVWRNANGTYLNAYYVGFYMLQLLLVGIIILVEPTFTFQNSTPLVDTVSSYTIAVLIAIVGIWVGVVLSNLMSKPKQKINISSRIRSIEQEYNIHLLSNFFLLLLSLTIITSLTNSYLVAAFSLTFSFSPIFVGFFWSRQRRLNRIAWIVILITNLVFHSIQGSRGTALFPIIFMIVGYMLSIRENKPLFRRRLTLFVIVGLISVPYLNMVAEYRKFYERGMDVSVDSYNKMLDFAMNSDYTIQDEEGGFHNTLGRLLIHPNIVAVHLTPDIVPYRGFESFSEEIASIFQLKGAEGNQGYLQARENLGYGSGVATRYGFSVNEYTSVEWPLFADGFSRFGYWGLFLYSMLFAIFLATLERFCLNLWRKNSLLSFTLTMFVLYNGVLSYMSSYYSFMKTLVFRMTFVFVVIWVVSCWIKNTNKRYL